MAVRLGLLAAIHLLLAADYTMVYLALPALTAETGLTVGDAQWVMHGYAIAFGGFMLVSGRAADVHGARRILVLGLVTLAAGSLAGGLIAQPLATIASRFVQGVGAAMCFPSMLALIGQGQAGESTRAISVWSAAGPAGLAAGTALGGLLLDAAGWRWIFLVNVPLALLFAGAAFARFSVSSGQAARSGLSLRNAMAAASALVLLISALVLVPATGWTSLYVLAPAALAVVLFRVFLLLERTDPHPLVPPSLLRNADLVLCMGVTGAIMGTFMALPYFQTQLYQETFALSASEAGMAFLLPCATQAAGARCSESASARLGTHLTVAAGLLLGAACLAIAGWLLAAGAGLPALLPWVGLAGFGQGLAWSTTWVIAGTAAPEDQRGSASGLVSTAFQVGGALGLCLLILGTMLVVGAYELRPGILREANAAASWLASAVILLAAGAAAHRWHAQRRQERRAAPGRAANPPAQEMARPPRR